MTRDELKSRLSAREDNFIERKASGVNPRELRQTACAFANSLPEGREGVIFVGVHDATGRVEGVPNPDSLQKRVRAALGDDCYPSIMHSMEVLQMDGKYILAIVVPSSANKPHFTGPAYLRVGSESIKASTQAYEDLIHSRHDKCQRILQMKNQIVTVLGLSYRIGSNKILKDSSYRESRECWIESCDAHTVRFQDIATREHLAEPLSRVEISVDEERHRPMLMVSMRI